MSVTGGRLIDTLNFYQWPGWRITAKGLESLPSGECQETPHYSSMKPQIYNVNQPEFVFPPDSFSPGFNYCYNS